MKAGFFVLTQRSEATVGAGGRIRERDYILPFIFIMFSVYMCNQSAGIGDVVTAGLENVEKGEERWKRIGGGVYKNSSKFFLTQIPSV